MALGADEPGFYNARKAIDFLKKKMKGNTGRRQQIFIWYQTI